MLQKLGFLPGFNKQVTSTGAESQWTGGENVRFRYGTPEKIGGWSQLGDSKLTGAARGLHHICLLYTSPSPRDRQKSRMPSSA